MSRKPVYISDNPELAHLKFDTYAKANTHYSNILGRWPLGEQLQSQDLEDVLALIRHHPEYQARVSGRTVIGVQVGLRDYGKRCFYACFLNDEKAHFSKKTCLDAARDATQESLAMERA